MIQGAVLPDWEIEALAGGRVVKALEYPLIEPYEPEQLAPSSYDVLLANQVRVPRSRHYEPIDLRKPVPDLFDQVPPTVMDNEGWVLRQGEFVLGATIERVNIPDFLVCRVEGKSSLARLGLQIEQAGYVDPGFQGNITLEIVNFGIHPIWLWPGERIAQLSFERLSSTCRQLYSGRYQHSNGAVGSRYNHKLTTQAAGAETKV